MWRTVIITKGERITIRDNWLVVYSENNEQRVPIGDLYSVVIDNRAAMLSAVVLTTLAMANVHIYFCDSKHIPVALSLPMNTHYKPLGVIKKQLALTDEFKDVLWQRIVEQKIRNQIICLKTVGVDPDKIKPIEDMCSKILPGDNSNREAAAAKKYFSALFGYTFKRTDDDVTNAALNYGYTIIRSSVAKTLTAYGYNCVLGIHHINEQNAFNLADDIMEPFRPLIDLWTDNSCDDLWDELTKANRRDLVNLVNVPVKMANKKMRVRYAIDKCVSSLTTSIENNDPKQLILPTLIPIENEFEDDEDG